MMVHRPQRRAMGIPHRHSRSGLVGSQPPLTLQLMRVWSREQPQCRRCGRCHQCCPPLRVSASMDGGHRGCSQGHPLRPLLSMCPSRSLSRALWPNRVMQSLPQPCQQRWQQPQQWKRSPVLSSHIDGRMPCQRVTVPPHAARQTLLAARQMLAFCVLRPPAAARQTLVAARQLQHWDLQRVTVQPHAARQTLVAAWQL